MADSASLGHLKTGLKAVDNVLSYVKQTQGQPSAKERSLFVASVALSYAVWENYAEDLAVEACTFLAEHVSPDAVPDRAKKLITDNTSPWELSVYPGWRELWTQRVKDRAKGKEDHDSEWGLQTANTPKVRALFELVGVDPFADLTDGKTDELDQLVKLRGSIVHTGKAPAGFRKAEAMAGRDLVLALAGQADQTVAKGVKAVAGQTPW